jgi:hypothetical protein
MPARKRQVIQCEYMIYLGPSKVKGQPTHQRCTRRFRWNKWNDPAGLKVCPVHMGKENPEPSGDTDTTPDTDITTPPGSPPDSERGGVDGSKEEGTVAESRGTNGRGGGGKKGKKRNLMEMRTETETSQASQPTQEGQPRIGTKPCVLIHGTTQARKVLTQSQLEESKGTVGNRARQTEC